MIHIRKKKNDIQHYEKEVKVNLTQTIEVYMEKWAKLSNEKAQIDKMDWKTGPIYFILVWYASH